MGRSLAAVLTKEHECLYEMIGTGHSNAKNLTILTLRTGIHEREIRRMIQELNENEKIVCNKQDGKGYYKPNCAEDYEAFYKLTSARGLSLLRKRNAIKRAYQKSAYVKNN